ncbi:MAG: hypothetical protein PHC75_07295 [Burkholderiales bacterium]|nr:hypothetical protein [Burkholderiales bacterium]
MQMLKLIVSLGLITVNLVACSNNNYEKTYPQSNIVYIDDESNALNGKKILLVKNTRGVVNQEQSTAEIKAIVAYAKNQPDVAIKITYITASNLANDIAKNLNQQIANKIYVDKCCKLDPGRAYLPKDSVSITLYK